LAGLEPGELVTRCLDNYELQPRSLDDVESAEPRRVGAGPRPFSSLRRAKPCGNLGSGGVFRRGASRGLPRVGRAQDPPLRGLATSCHCEGRSPVAISGVAGSIPATVDPSLHSGRRKRFLHPSKQHPRDCDAIPYRLAETRLLTLKVVSSAIRSKCLSAWSSKVSARIAAAPISISV